MSKVDPAVTKRVNEWLKSPYYDEETKKEIQKLLKENPASLAEAFYTDLSFGTAGMRSLMGIGTSRINIYTIRLATQGLANYLLKQNLASSVLIGFDSRHHSKEFAEEAACVLAGNGITVYLLKELRPTPFVSFGVRYKKATAGIMITASHNPAEYNGYKVYWSDGAQVVFPHDTGIMHEVHAIKSIETVKRSDLSSPLIHLLDETLDSAYLDAIRPLQLHEETNKRLGNTLSITYTSLHGTGITLAPIALKDWGFSSLHYVDKQIIPDGDFPTVKFPNPEFKEALALGIDTMLKTHADLLIANDPDADRLGVVVKHEEKPRILNGNEIAALCASYLAETLEQQKRLPRNGAFVTTIVTTEILKAIASIHSLHCMEVLTGFKYIGEKIHEWEISENGYGFLFGAEESYGYLVGTQVRDKDAIVCSCLVVEMALQAKQEGLTLVDRLEALYRKYGMYREKQLSLAFEPTHEGMEKMASLMRRLREQPPRSFLDQEVVALEDYETLVRTSFISGKQEKLSLPKSDVLLFRLADQSKLVIRPSGTEPKIKIYAALRQKSFSTLTDGITACEKQLDALLSKAKQDLLG